MGKGLSAFHLAVFLAFLVGMWIGYMAQPGTPGRASDTLKMDEELAILLKEKQELRQQVQQLEQENRTLRAESKLDAPANTIGFNTWRGSQQSQSIKSTLLSSVLNQEDASRQVVSDEELNRLKAIEAQRKISLAEQHLTEIQQQYGTDPATAIRKEFEHEVIDNAWSHTQEISIRNAFSSSPTLTDTAFVDAECKETQCRISLLTGGERESFSGIEQLYQEVSSLGEWDGYYTVIDPVTGLTSVYLQRK